MDERTQRWLLWAMLIGIAAGGVSGYVFGEQMASVAWIGTFFLRSLKMLIVPLIFCSMIVGVGALGDIRRLGRTGGFTLAYYTGTTALAVLTGIILVTVIQPGVAPPGKTAAQGLSASADSLATTAETVVTPTGGRSMYGRISAWNLMNTAADSLDMVLQNTGTPETIRPELRQSIDALRSAAQTFSPLGPETHGVDFASHSINALNQTAPHLQSLAEKVEEIDDPAFAFSRVEAAALFIKQVPVMFRPGAATALSQEDCIESILQLRTARTAEVPETVRGKEDIGFTDIILSLVSPNIIGAMANMDILPLVIFSLIFGALLSTLGEKGQAAIEFFGACNDAIMKMVHLIMFLAPIGVFGLVASKLGEAGGGEAFLAEIMEIGLYMLVVVVGLGVHAFVTLPLILRIFGRRKPGKYAAGMARACATAFSTASSSATLPVTLEGAIETNKVRPASANFVCPLGATINMDGTALYEAVAAIFIAQASGIELGPYSLIVIFLTATLAAIGAAGIPQAGLVTMVIVLRAVDLPLEGIGLILTVDWFLDRLRTTVNVWGDAVGAATVDTMTSSADNGDDASG